MAKANWKKVDGEPPAFGDTGQVEVKGDDGKRRIGFLAIAGTRAPEEGEIGEQPVHVVQIEDGANLDEFAIGDFTDWRPRKG